MNTSLYEIIKPDEIEKSASVLSAAFYNDALMQWMFVEKEHYEKHASKLFETWIKYCILYGIAWRTPQFESIALRKKPQAQKFTLWRMLWAGMLKTPRLLGKEAFQRLMKFDNFTAKLRDTHLQKNKYIYCWMLGTDPDHRSQGFGSTLAKATFDMAALHHLPCYLETADEKGFVA